MRQHQGDNIIEGPADFKGRRLLDVEPWKEGVWKIALAQYTPTPVQFWTAYCGTEYLETRDEETGMWKCLVCGNQALLPFHRPGCPIQPTATPDYTGAFDELNDLELARLWREVKERGGPANKPFLDAINAEFKVRARPK